MPSERFDFPNAKGERLAGVLDLPAGAPPARRAPTRCLPIASPAARTCWPPSASPRRSMRRASRCCASTSPASARAKASSPTPPSPRTSLTSSPPPIICAQTRGPPSLLIGHSLGGAAVLAAAEAVAEAQGGGDHRRALRSRPCHASVRRQGRRDPRQGRGRGGARRAAVPHPAGNSCTTSPSRSSPTRIARLRKALLIFHSPTDETVGIENAAHIFAAAKHPKSFVSLAGADHLLTRRSDAAYVANVLAAWAERYLDAAPMPEARRGRSAAPSWLRKPA